MHCWRVVCVCGLWGSGLRDFYSPTLQLGLQQTTDVIWRIDTELCDPGGWRCFFLGGSVWIPKGIWLVAIKWTDESNRTKLRSNTISSQISSLVMMSSSFGKSGQGEKLLTVNQGLPLWALHLPLMATLKQALCCNVKSLQKWCCQSSIPPTHVPMILRANYGHDFRCTQSLNQNCRF